MVIFATNSVKNHIHTNMQCSAIQNTHHRHPIAHLVAGLWGVYCEFKVLFMCYINRYIAVFIIAELILGLGPANERWHYFVTKSFIGWLEALNHPCYWVICNPVITAPDCIAKSFIYFFLQKFSSLWMANHLCRMVGDQPARFDCGL